MKLNGLELPSALTKALESGAWKMPTDHALVQRVFPMERLIQPILHDMKSLEFENANWSKGTLPPFLLGTKAGLESPGDIDTSKSVIIGDLGPDLPIALDYRSSYRRPRVVYLIFHSNSTHWVTATPDVESLISALGLD